MADDTIRINILADVQNAVGGFAEMAAKAALAAISIRPSSIS